MSCAAALLPGRFGPVICSGNGAADVCGGGGGRKNKKFEVERRCGEKPFGDNPIYVMELFM